MKGSGTRFRIVFLVGVMTLGVSIAAIVLYRWLMNRFSRPPDESYRRDLVRSDNLYLSLPSQAITHEKIDELVKSINDLIETIGESPTHSQRRYVAAAALTVYPASPSFQTMLHREHRVEGQTSVTQEEIDELVKSINDLIETIETSTQQDTDKNDYPPPTGYFPSTAVQSRAPDEGAANNYIEQHIVTGNVTQSGTEAINTFDVHASAISPQTIQMKPEVEQDEVLRFFDLSISHARRIAKGHSSPFLVDLYFPELEQHVKTRQIEAFQKEPVEEHRYDTELTQGLPVIIELTSPSIEFTPPKKTNLSSQHNSIQFVGMPAVTSVPGLQAVLITIRSADNDTEYFSRTFAVQVVDFAFDHVSRPKLEAAISMASAAGAVTMWALALLGQIDQTLGLAAGTAAAGASAFFVARIQWLYRAASVTNQFHNQP